MKVFFKYLFWLLSCLTLFGFFIFSTHLGAKTLGYILEEYLSTKTTNKIEVESFNLDAYPHLKIEMKINGGAKVYLEGVANRNSVDMQYHLTGETYRWNDMVMGRPLDILGRIKGEFSNLAVLGKGKAFDGNISFDFKKTADAYRDVTLSLHNVQSERVLKFLKKKPLLRGRANIESRFKLFSKYKRDGKSIVTMQRGFLPTLVPYIPFVLDSTIIFENFLYKFQGELNSKVGSLVVRDAYYHKILKKAEAHYDLKVKELSYFETFSNYQFNGELKSKGFFHYEDEKLLLKGTTDKFEGELAYQYKNRHLDLSLKGLSLVKLLEQFHYPKLLSAKIFGNAEYDADKKIAIVNTKLHNVHFRKTKLTDMISKATGVNLLAETYDKSSFVGGYQNERLNSILKIDNGVNHFYLTDTILDKTTNGISSKFALRVDNDELFGEIYGTLEDPSVSIDMRRLLKSQLKKRFGSFLGTSKTEKLKSDIKNLKGTLSEKLGDFF